MLFCMKENAVFMKKNKLIVILLLVLLFSFNSQAKELVIGISEYPPYVNINNDLADGSMLAYLTNMFNGDFERVRFIAMPRKRGLQELEKGTVDLFFPHLKSNDGYALIGEPILHVVPGLCFKKDSFVPILSAPKVLDSLHIGVPAGIPLVPALHQTLALLTVIEGSDTLERGIQLLRSNRIDSFYHPSPINVYHHENPLSKEIACSHFYGYSAKVNLALSPNMTREKEALIKQLYSKSIREQPFEHFLLER